MSSAEQVQTKSARKSGKKKKPQEKVTTLSPCPEFEKQILNEILEDLKSEGIISTAPSETVSSQSLSVSKTLFIANVNKQASITTYLLQLNRNLLLLISIFMMMMKKYPRRRHPHVSMLEKLLLLIRLITMT